MQISTISIRNFYSFSELDVDFREYSGLVLIEGKNLDSRGSNGSGKSAIIEAVCWGLFNRTVRKSTEESMVNVQAGEGLSVTLTLEVDDNKLKIERTKRPTSLNFFVNGKNRNKENAAETQKLIEEVIQSDYKSFLASVIFGQHADVDFLSSSPEDKRNIIKNCFNIDDIFRKRDTVKSLKSVSTGELKAVKAVLANLRLEEGKLKSLIPDKKYKYVELPSLQSILDAEATTTGIRGDISTRRKAISDAKNRLRKISPALEKGIHCEEKECPICKNRYEVSQTKKDVSSLKKEKKELDSNVKDNELNISKLEKEIENIKPEYSSSLWAKYNEKNQLVKESQTNINNYNATVTQIEELGKIITALESEIEVMKFWEKAFSEQGMIRYVIRNILEYFNLKANEYLSLLSNNQFSIEFSDNLSEVITNNGQQIKFISLSGGEKRRVNLAIMLALQDLQQKISRTKSNLIFFDEVGENLDNIAMEAIFTLLNILKNQDKNKVIFVITHNNYLKSLFSETPTISVVKKKGISRLNGSN